jgi:hypothetical protein
MHGPGRESLVYKVGAYDEPELLLLPPRTVLDSKDRVGSVQEQTGLGSNCYIGHTHYVIIE